MKSEFYLVNRCVPLPKFSGTRIMHMPMIHGQPESLPDDLAAWRNVILACAEAMPQHVGKVVYLTIDEKIVETGESHRRSGLHVDGYHRTESSGHSGGWGGGGGGWGKTGLLTISNPAGCRAWDQEFDGEPEVEGECEHLRSQCGDGHLLEPNGLYWLSPLCVHESLPMKQRTQRTFVRLSMPSQSDWYDGYTVNCKGVQPTGRIMPRRRFMAACCCE